MKKFLLLLFIFFLILNFSSVEAKVSKENQQYSMIEILKKIDKESDNEIVEKRKETDRLPITYAQSKYKISSINPTIGNNTWGISFPGLRGPNQLVVYTPSYGVRTNTNEFGTEVIVVKDVVVAISGANSIIPSNGYVISGHGVAKKWMNKNLSIGANIKIDYNNKILYSSLTSDSYIYSAKAKIKEVESIVSYYKNSRFRNQYSKQSYEYIKKAEDCLKKAVSVSSNSSSNYAISALNYASQALEYAIPYSCDEFKGIWVRPTETTPAKINETVLKIKNMGIENIFLETYYHGKTIFDSQTLRKYKVTSQREEFVGFDPLAEWIKSAHKNGLKVNVWFETFYVGNENPALNPKNILSVYPSWNNITKGTYNSTSLVYSRSEHNGYFLDPANPNVRMFLNELLIEIISKYDIDGVNLDYIRYPQASKPNYSIYENSNWGYTNFARQDFLNKYSLDPLNIRFGTPEWKLWALYRQNCINSFVKNTKDLLNRKNIMLTTVVFPDQKNSLDVKMQDWGTWIRGSYVDGVTVLILTSDKNSTAAFLKEFKTGSCPQTKIYAGLFSPFMNANPEDLLRQIHEIRKLNLHGFVIFDYAHMTDRYVDILAKSILNKD